MAQENKIILKSSIKNRKDQISYCIHSHKNINSGQNNEKENLYSFNDKTKIVNSKDEKQNISQIEVKSTLEKTKRKPLQNLYKTNKTINLKKHSKTISTQKVYEDVSSKEFPVQKHSELITMRRNYDSLCMENLSLDCSSDKNYFFEDETTNNKEIPKSVMICTPANSFILHNHIKAIKEVRKGVSKYSQSNLKSDSSNSLHSKIYNHGTYSINPFKKVECLQFKNIRSQSILGAVNLDSEENFATHYLLYSINYLKSIFEHQLKREITYKLSDSFLHKFTITSTNRSIVINWLIKLQAYMKVEHVVVYTAVRIMDKALDTLNIPLNMLQLVALASYWISLKFHAVNHREVSWMVKQSDGAYTNNELILMERRIFHANNFDIISIDYSTYIHYYILYLELKNADLISQCSHYMLDCALLDCRFTRILPSMMAAATIFTSLHLLSRCAFEIWGKLKKYQGYYSPDELQPIKTSLIEMLKEVNNPNFLCREVFYKFSSKRYLSVSNVIADMLDSSK